MGKGTVADWHKQQRKKELQKNKESRLAVRNEKVLSEKTVGSVRNEVERLEQQYGKSVPHAVQMKIDRLKKELKLLQEKEAEDKKNRVHKKSYVKPTAFEPLAKPAMSIYYDERFNPYGEPPPGQPRMFHKRGGGTTLRLDEACVPGEEEEKVEEQESKSAATATPPLKPAADSASDIASNQKTQRDAALRPSSSHSREAKHHSTTTDTASSPPKAAIAAQSFDPSHVPDLPPPSAAVKRSRGTVDIWASLKEEDYNAAAATHWYYTDTAGQQQGPFATEQMKEWNNYFPPDTPVRPSSSMEWRPMNTVKELRLKKKAAPQPKGGVLDRIAALRGNKMQQGTAADRIAALRGDTAPTKMTSEDMNMQDRVAALRSDLMADKGVKGRLAALRGDRDQTNDAHNTQGDDVQDRIAALKSQLHSPVDDAVGNEVAGRIAELRAMKEADGANSLPIPPPDTKSDVPPPVTIDSSVIPLSSFVNPYSLPIPPPAAENIQIPPHLPLPPPPPSIDANSIPPSIPMPPLPMGPNDIPPSFPVPPPPSLTTDIPPAYLPPPTVDSPPAFPVPPTVVPPSFPSPSTMNNLPPKKKKAKVDKSLVAFVPSHLLRNKR